jgi:hypothetical protein
MQKCHAQGKNKTFRQENHHTSIAILWTQILNW